MDELKTQYKSAWSTYVTPAAAGKRELLSQKAPSPLSPAIIHKGTRAAADTL